jgi:hypothetical protein
MRDYIHNKNTTGKPFSPLLRQQFCGPEKQIAKLRTGVKNNFVFIEKLHSCTTSDFQITCTHRYKTLNEGIPTLMQWWGLSVQMIPRAMPLVAQLLTGSASPDRSRVMTQD